MRLKTLAAILLCGPSLVSAGVNTWTAIGPAGGSINSIVFGGTANTVFATGSSGIYRSVDDGASWQAVKTDFQNGPTGVAIDPSDTSRVYFVAPNWPSLYVSTDGGATVQASSTLPKTVIAASQVGVSQDGNTLYIASGGQLFSSVDRGATWVQRTAVSSDPTARVLKLVVDPTDANSVYVSAQLSGTSAGVLATHDGGVTWQVLYSGSPSTYTTLNLAINAASPLQLWAARYDGLQMSVNGGQTWTNVLPGTAFVAVGLDPENPAIVYAGTASGLIYRSADAAATWANVTGAVNVGEPGCIAVDPTQSTRVLLGGGADVAGSTDSATTWTIQDTGIIGSMIGGLSADPTTDRIYVNVPQNGVYSSTGGSTSLVAGNNAALIQLQNTGGSGSELYSTSLLARPGGLLVSLTSGLATSQDGGNTWTLSQVVPPGGTSQQLFYMTSSASAPQTILVASLSNIYRSSDGGNLWTAVTSGLPASTSIGNLIAAQSDGRVAYAYLYNSSGGSASGIYSSNDAGLTWAPTSSNPTSGPTILLAVDPTAATTLYGSTSSALLKSTDGGATWLPLAEVIPGSGEAPFTLTVDPLHPQILIGATTDLVVRSVDRGASWEILRSNTLPYWSPMSLLVDPLRPESLLVGSIASGVQQFSVEPDLSVTALAPAAPVASGVPLTSGFMVTNLGPFAATDVRVTVQLPAGTQSATVTVPGGTCATGSSTASCTIPVLRSGSAAAVAVTANGLPTGMVQIVGTVAADQPDSNPQNNSATVTATVAAIADLSVAVSGNATANSGDSITYTLTVSNTGPNTASAPALTFQLAAGLSPGAITTTNGTCTINTSSQVSCALTDLAAGSSVTITVAATTSTVGSQVSTAQVSSSAVDLSSANNSATMVTAVSAAPAGTSSGTTTGTGTGTTSGTTTTTSGATSAGSGHGGGGGLSLWDIAVLAVLFGYLRLAGMRRRWPVLEGVD